MNIYSHISFVYQKIFHPNKNNIMIDKKNIMSSLYISKLKMVLGAEAEGELAGSIIHETANNQQMQYIIDEIY